MDSLQPIHLQLLFSPSLALLLLQQSACSHMCCFTAARPGSPPALSENRPISGPPNVRLFPSSHLVHACLRVPAALFLTTVSIAHHCLTPRPLLEFITKANFHRFITTMTCSSQNTSSMNALSAE